MKLNNYLASILLILFLNACGANSSKTPGPPAQKVTCPTGDNVMKVTINGSLCGTTQYPNEPCTSVTVCSATDPSNCQTITDILVDTGSYGLRVFRSALTVPVTPSKVGTQDLFECAQFGDGTSLWGQVETAWVKLGNEPPVSTPIMVIDPIAPSTSNCPKVGTDPKTSGFHGILGVGLFKQDCGSACSRSNNFPKQYFACTGSSCLATAVSLTSQIQNPVALLPKDNNGVILQFPSVDSGGAKSVDGCLILGIGAISSTATVYPVDNNGNMTTVFAAYSSKSMHGYIDSGSNGLYFPAPADGSLPACKSNLSQFYCPAAIQFLQATNADTSRNAIAVPFQVGNAETLSQSDNIVFSNFCGQAIVTSSSGAYFDWGLPFFLGRTIYVGIEDTTSSLGTGPYWAY